MITYKKTMGFYLGLMIMFSACTVRETHTARTATEQLLLSRAAERAAAKLDVKKWVENKRVYVDSSFLEAYDKEYVIGALRHQLSENGAFLVPLEPMDYEGPDGKLVKLGPQLTVEVRSGGLGIYDNSFGFGAPYLPLPIPQTGLATFISPLWAINRQRQEGWAKFQVWIYDQAENEYVAQSPDLWGNSYYNQWWFLTLGPFDFSNDVYPDNESDIGPNRNAGRYKDNVEKASDEK